MTESENFVGVIQARMMGKRLPGKVMADIVGKPMIWHIVQRLKNSKTLSNVVISTTNKEYDKPLCEYAESENIPYYAGSENDILDRLYHTGKKFNATTIVKINADCPLIDPKLVDIAIKKYESTEPKPDLIINSSKKSYPMGLGYGVINFQTISSLWNDLTNPFWREYIYMYIIENKNNYSVIEIENDKDMSNFRWTVDYQEDLEFVRVVFQNLYTEHKIFGMSEILELLNEKPEISRINSKYDSKDGIRWYESLKSKYG